MYSIEFVGGTRDGKIYAWQEAPHPQLHFLKLYDAAPTPLKEDWGYEIYDRVAYRRNEAADIDYFLYAVDERSA